MNRRGFLSSILLACVAPKILIPKAKDHFNWRVRRRRGLYIAEFHYAIMPPDPKTMEHWVFCARQLLPGEPPEKLILDEHYVINGDVWKAPGTGKLRVEYRVNHDGTIAFGSEVGSKVPHGTIEA